MNILLDINRNEAMIHLAGYLRRAGKLDRTVLIFNSHKEKERLSSLTAGFEIVVRSDFNRRVRAEQTPSLGIIEDDSELASIWQWVRGDRGLFSVSTKGKFFVDRTPHSHEQVLERVRRVYHGVQRMIEELQPDLILLTDVVNMSKYVIAEVAWQTRIPTMFLLPVRLGRHQAFSNTPYEHFRFVYDRLDDLRRQDYTSEPVGEAERVILDILNRKNQYHDAAQMSGRGITESDPLDARFLARNYRDALARTVRYLAGRSRGRQTRRVIASTFTGPIEMSRVWLRQKHSLPGYRFDRPVKGEQFMFFPLHSEPETAIGLNAPWIGNQAELVWSLATSIPIEMKLYVKDHPRMYGLRPVQYYERMKQRSPNVRVLHPLSNTLDIVPHAKLVVVVSGTPGFEALLHGVPVIALGACHFQYLTGVTRTRNPVLLPETIREALRNPPDPDTIKRDALLFVRACLDESYPIGWYSDIVNGPSDYDYSCQEFQDFCVYVEKQIDRVMKDPGWLQPLRTGYTL